MNIQKLIEESNLAIPKERILFNEPMKKHSTFKIGGPAECFIKVQNIQELKEILKFANNNKIEITLIGNGSNLLVLDGGIKGITIMMNLEKYEILEEYEKENKENIEKTTKNKEKEGKEKDSKTKVQVIAESGCKLGKLAQIFLKNEITGFEELSGIPGTIGGAVKMDAGAHGKEMKDIIEEVTAIDYQGNEKTLKNGELEFGYRTSLFKKEKYIITKVKMNLEKGNKEEIKSKMEKYANYRKEKQPIEYPSAGSTFKRGQDFITAKLIDDAGLKGYSIGDAMISTKHSGFIINRGNATAKDILSLVKYVEEEVEKKFGKKIELEIEIVGKKGENK